MGGLFIHMLLLTMVRLPHVYVGQSSPDFTVRRIVYLDADELVAKYVRAFADLTMKLDLQTDFEIQIIVSGVDDKLDHLGEDMIEYFVSVFLRC